MRDVEKRILKSLEEDIEILKRRNVKNNEIKEYLELYKDFSFANTKEYKKEIDKLIEKIKC